MSSVQFKPSAYSWIYFYKSIYGYFSICDNDDGNNNEKTVKTDNIGSALLISVD